MGFDVEHPVIASARAQQLKAPAVPRPSQANEEVFAGIAASDSTEIFLCQGSPDGTAAWRQEFGEGLENVQAGAARAVSDDVNLPGRGSTLTRPCSFGTGPASSGGLSRTLDESTSAAVLDRGDIAYIARVTTRSIMTVGITVGTRFPAHATSMGRVLLSGCPRRSWQTSWRTRRLKR